MKKNKKKWIILIIIFLLLLCIGLIFLFGMNKKYVITFDTDRGSKISSFKVKDDEIIELPEEPTKEGYKFSTWVNEKNNIVKEGTKIKEDTILKAIWVKDDAETITMSFDTDGTEELENVVIEKGSIILLPVTPIKKGYIFAGWINENGNIVSRGINIEENIVLKAVWIKENSEIKTITLNTDGGNSIEKIIIEKGKVMRFPVNPTKAGSVFKGWVDGNGNSITKDTIITDNITIKAVWIEPYTCPSNCTPSIDGSICTKVSTKELSTGTGCPSSYSLIDGKCLNISDSVMPDTAYSCSDGTTPVDGLCVNQAREVTSAWDCVGKEYFENGKCIMTQTFTDVCPNSSYTLYDDCQGGGCVRLCIKKTDKISALACPNEYTKDGDICKKTETIKCTAN